MQTQDSYAELAYPERDKNGLSVCAAIVDLLDVRAAQSLIIKFDFNRDGYVCYMQKVKQADGYMEELGGVIEVEFIPAWSGEVT